MKKISKLMLVPLGIGILAVVLAYLPRHTSAQGPPPPPPPPPTTNVDVVNTSTSPVLVGDVDNPAHDPIVGNCAFNSAGACIISFRNTISPNPTTSVPFGYELVIEYVSGSFALPTGEQLLRAYVQTDVNGTSTNGYVVPVKIGTDGTFDYYSFGEATRLYGDPGNEVSYFVGDVSSIPVTLDSFNVSGYLVKCGTGAGCPALP
jgi:hypothetical protein